MHKGLRAADRRPSSMQEEGKEFKIAAAMAKYHASKVAQKASGLAIEWCGGVGFTRDLPVQKFWRDSM